LNLYNIRVFIRLFSSQNIRHNHMNLCKAKENVRTRIILINKIVLIGDRYVWAEY
jgi:hypothetical protein